MDAKICIAMNTLHYMHSTPKMTGLKPKYSKFIKISSFFNLQKSHFNLTFLLKKLYEHLFLVIRCTFLLPVKDIVLLFSNPILPSDIHLKSKIIFK